MIRDWVPTIGERVYCKHPQSHEDFSYTFKVLAFEVDDGKMWLSVEETGGMRLVNINEFSPEQTAVVPDPVDMELQIMSWIEKSRERHPGMWPRKRNLMTSRMWREADRDQRSQVLEHLLAEGRLAMVNLTQGTVMDTFVVIRTEPGWEFAQNGLEYDFHQFFATAGKPCPSSMLPSQIKPVSHLEVGVDELRLVNELPGPYTFGTMRVTHNRRTMTVIALLDDLGRPIQPKFEPGGDDHGE